MMTSCIIKFRNGDLRMLRDRLLEDLSHEYFAILLGKKQSIGGKSIITIHDIKIPGDRDYNGQSVASLNIKKDFIHQALAELTNRSEIDTMIDVHTHPFSKKHVGFSGIDDRDEKRFFRFLQEEFDDIHYASIVFSQMEYSARLWMVKKKQILAERAVIKAQISSEQIQSSDFDSQNEEKGLNYEIFNRSILALGLDTMRHIMKDQTITIVGVGGLGSVIAEHLVHTGFPNLNLIDFDKLEISNLNRIVGATYEEAKRGDFKVDAVKRHLLSINPVVHISTYALDVNDKKVEEAIALSDWLIVATDNHSSRFKCQELSVKYFVPMISTGVNITVEDGGIKDMSGEVITSRMGDNLCLNCLGRVNYIKVGQETHPDKTIRSELVKRGYVSGLDVKEPAVKTLNTFLGTMAVEVLVNQYTERQRHAPILVFESNGSMAIYEDRDSVETRHKDCFTCNV